MSGAAAEARDIIDIVPGDSLDTARRRLAAVLLRHSFDTPALDARVLVGYALGLDHAGLIRDSARPLTRDEAVAVAAVAARRLKREPVARITGIKEFWSLPLSVNAATLVPRPETETVVEAALAAIDARGGRQRPLRVLDIGTGSGALLLALLHELPRATAVGTDISIDALTTARGNSMRLDLAGRAAFVACDIAVALRGPFDLIVSNPPYVEHAAIARLAPGVRDYEPHTALDGGIDGLEAYRAIAAQAPHLLAPGGTLLVELGAGQADAVAAIFDAKGLVTLATHPDLMGIQRALSVACA